MNYKKEFQENKSGFNETMDRSLELVGIILAYLNKEKPMGWRTAWRPLEKIANAMLTLAGTNYKNPRAIRDKYEKLSRAIESIEGNSQFHAWMANEPRRDMPEALIMVVSAIAALEITIEAGANILQAAQADGERL